MSNAARSRPNKLWLPAGPKRALLAVGFVLCGAQSALAQEITFQVSATVGVVFDPGGGLDDRIGAGDSLTAWYSFDPATPAVVNDPGESAYAGAVNCVRAEVEGLQFNGTPSPGLTQNLLIVQDDAVAVEQPEDGYFVLLNGAGPDFSLFSLGLNVPGPSDAVTGTGIPTQPPDPSLFETADLSIQFSQGAAFLTASIDDIVVSQDPLPCGGSPGTAIQVASTTQPPQIDGKLDVGEWKSAVTRPLDGGVMRLLHDEVRLYVLIDMLADTTDDPAHEGGFDQYWLAFDVDEDAAVTANVDRRYRQQEATGNLRFETYCAGCGFGFNSASPSTRSARGEGFGCFLADGSATFFPNLSCSSHRLWEVAIDLQEIQALGDQSARMGYLVQSGSSELQNFPADLTDLASFIEIELLGDTASGDPGEPAIQTGLELTQAVQDDFNSLELVAGKPTIARTYLTRLTPETATAIVSVAAERDGVDLPGSPLVRWAIAEQVADSSIDTRRSRLGNSENWRLPEEWTHGDVDFSLSFRRPWLLTAGGGSPQRVSFVDTVTPTYWTVPIDVGTAASPNLPSAAFMDRAEDATLDVFPVEEIDFVRRPPLRTGNVSSAGLLGRLNELDAASVLAWTLGLIFTGESPFDLPDQIFGFTPMGLCSDPPDCLKTAGGSSDPVWGEGNGRVSWGGPTASSGRYVLAHEINHNLDRNPDGGWGNHAGGCRADESATWPYPDPNIQEWGFQARRPLSQFVSGRVVEDFTPDLMSYCQEFGGPVKWISPYRWQVLLDNIYRVPLAASANSRGRASAAAEDVEDAYYIRGRVNIDGSGELSPALAQPGWPEPSLGTGDHAVEVRNCAGDLLSERRFTPNFEGVEGEASVIFPFFYQLPADPEACAIRLVGNSSLLAEIARSANAPVVESQSPGVGELWSATHLAQWLSTDADGDTLSFTLLYSPDDGATWRPIETGISGFEAEVDSTTLAASDTARLRVIATDGFHTVHDDSDAFSVAKAPPRITISSDVTSGPLRRNTPIEFSAVARGKDGTPIPGGGYLWWVDGEPVAQGNPVTIRLVDGAEEVSVSASEGDGPIGEVSFLVPEPGRLAACVAVVLALALLRVGRIREHRGRILSQRGGNV